MFLNGSLENFSVADILQLLSFSKQTGALHVAGDVTGVLYFDDGEAYFATKEGAGPLEDTVAAAGISREDWNAALETGRQSHAAGQALRERGVAADLIGYVVHHIVSDATFELMRMPRGGGSFDFRVGEKHAVGPVHKLRVDELVAEVRDRLAEWDAISEFISSPSDVVSAPTELVQESVELTVSREQWALLVATIRNDRATVSELARETGRSEAEVAGALHPLIGSGLMEVEARGEPADSFDSPPGSDSSESDYAAEVLLEATGPASLAPAQGELSWWGDQPADETTLSWEPLEPQPESPGGPLEGLPSDQTEGLPSDQTEGLPSDQTEGLPSDQTEPEILEPSGSEPDEWRFEGDSAEQEPGGDSEAWFPAVPELAPEETALWSEPETVDSLDTSRPLAEPGQTEETEAGDALSEAAEAESPLWDLEGPRVDSEERPAEEQHDELPLSPAETIDVGQPEVESAGFRTLALQELRDLAGTAPVQTATGRPTNSKKTAETSDDKPPAQPKVRALKRLIAAVRGL